MKSQVISFAEKALAADLAKGRIGKDLAAGKLTLAQAVARAVQNGLVCYARELEARLRREEAATRRRLAARGLSVTADRNRRAMAVALTAREVELRQAALKQAA